MEPTSNSNHSETQPKSTKPSTTEHPPSYTTPTFPPKYSKPQYPPSYRRASHTSRIGYEYEESSQNFPTPEHMDRNVPTEYKDPKAADLARRCSQSNREDLRAMLDYFVNQMEQADKHHDPALIFQNM